jgi:hypothetical protein
LAVVVADGSEKNPHFNKYQALADQLRGQPHVKKNFSISTTNNIEFDEWHPMYEMVDAPLGHRVEFNWEGRERI